MPLLVSSEPVYIGFKRQVKRKTRTVQKVFITPSSRLAGAFRKHCIFESAKTSFPPHTLQKSRHSAHRQLEPVVQSNPVTLKPEDAIYEYIGIERRFDRNNGRRAACSSGAKSP
jgi:hypothetical protein